MTYKLQDSSEETAHIQVTDTYGLLPITNELLIALTYEGKDSDHVADALAQFEEQAIDLSRSLDGDLTNSFNEQSDNHGQHTPFVEEFQEYADALTQAVSEPHIDTEHARQAIEDVKNALDAYKDVYPLKYSDNDTTIFETLEAVLYTINQGLDNPKALGYVRTLGNNDTPTVRKETLADLAEIIIDQVGMLDHAE